MNNLKPPKNTDRQSGITRRSFLRGISLLTPTLGLIAVNGNALQSLLTRTTVGQGATATATPAALACVATPAQTEGPYFVDEMLKRTDIRVDPSDNSVRAGLPLTLQIGIFSVNGKTCLPLSGAQVDVWHCDATGLYSDVSANNTVGKKFLRGYQITDDMGKVEFLTIYPGFYQGRTVHIHMMIRVPEQGTQAAYQFTSQLYFDDTVSDTVYKLAPYTGRGTRGTHNINDGILNGALEALATADPDDIGAQVLLTLSKNDKDGSYIGKVNIGVDLSKPATDVGAAGGNGGPAVGPGGRGGQPPTRPTATR